ncbi:hypothetical protein [Shewanella sp. YLB-07]|uniref:hypothetical protein n=1 Tax=Shewanella sp. YLB-07 TaxID=2601268 RepID=UPI00128BBBE5|nr:hypothetical protein [Shewanella sp. YLB-07]MPY26365.1 hypothetical protein [Shewanella sp. YLB-07]
MKYPLILLILSLTACSSTSQIDLKACDISINFDISKRVKDRNILDLEALKLLVNQHYNKEPKSDNPLNIELKKAYLGRNHLIISANAVIQVTNKGEKVYFRSNEVDTNMISSKSEWQYALEVAVFESIDKAILKYSTCKKRT